MGYRYYRYHLGKFISQNVKLMALIVIGSMILFVPPEAWFPGQDFIPNFWQRKALIIVLAEMQNALALIGFITICIWCVYQMYKVVK